MDIEQFVMAYGVEQDRLRSLLPDGFSSLRPVLRINAEIRGGRSGYVEFNTAVEKDGTKGWLNVGAWEEVGFVKMDGKVVFETDFLKISFTPVGIEGGCPAEKDNDGCFFLGESPRLRPSEKITANKEFCDCEFKWLFGKSDARGKSIGKTLPAVCSEAKISYPRQDFTPQNVVAIPCEQVLGAYVVRFVR